MAVFNSYLKLPEGGNAEIDEPIHVQFRYNLINIIILFYSEYVAIICHDDLCTHHLLDH